VYELRVAIIIPDPPFHKRQISGMQFSHRMMLQNRNPGSGELCIRLRPVQNGSTLARYVVSIDRGYRLCIADNWKDIIKVGAAVRYFSMFSM